MTAETKTAIEAATSEVKIPQEKKEHKLVKSIVIDTVTEIMKRSVDENMKRMNFDKWRDFGLELCQFINELVDMGFTIVGITGREGTGKTYGMKFLEAGTNIYYNCDNKEISYKGARAVYGTKQKPTIYQKLPKTYSEIIENLKKVKKNGLLSEQPLAFVLMHIAEFKDAAGNTRERSRVQGNVASTTIDSMLTMNYYAEVVPDGAGGVIYRLRTRNTGFNTGRTMEEQHNAEFIDNNFQVILDSYLNY